MRITHILKCLEILSRTREWLHAYNFNQYEEIFIGHRGCARISDAAKQYPYLIETKNDPSKPRMYIYRLKWENLTEAMLTLKELDLQAYSFLRPLLLKRNASWQEKKIVAEYTDQGTVRMVEKLVVVSL